MLFRRLARHVTDQNWTAVGLDFAIVVIGVFIGIQVANWNDARTERATEQKMLGSLYQDIEQAQSFIDGLQDRRPKSIASMADAYEKLMAAEPTALSEDECNAIFVSGISAFRFPMLATLDRAQETKDQQLSAAISSYSQSVDQVELLLNSSFRNSVEMGQAFPNLIRLTNYIGEQDELRIGATCDLGGMRVDQQFINAFAYNRDMQDSLNARMAPLFESFVDIRVNLERLLETDRD